MVRASIATILLLGMVGLLTAQNDGLSREELNRRRQNLNAQAEQIKQETRFEGRIEVLPETNRITNFRGNFAGIRVPAIDDTLGFEQVFDEILDRVLPHFPVNRRDLSKEMQRVSNSRIFVRYRQIANGFDIEGNSSIGLIYYYDRELFVINNGLACLDPTQLPTEPRISEEEAIRIYLENVEIPEYRRSDPHYSKPRFTLMYSRDRDEVTGRVVQNAFRLAWIGGAELRMIVDAVTGEIITLYDHAKHNIKQD